jgi:hypothetical protein
MEITAHTTLAQEQGIADTSGVRNRHLRPVGISFSLFGSLAYSTGYGIGWLGVDEERELLSCRSDQKGGDFR